MSRRTSTSNDGCGWIMTSTAALLFQSERESACCKNGIGSLPSNLVVVLTELFHRCQIETHGKLLLPCGVMGLDFAEELILDLLPLQLFGRFPGHAPGHLRRSALFCGT